MTTDTDKIRLMLAYLCVSKEAEASLIRKIEILDRFDLTDKDISLVCKCTVQSVRNARQLSKKASHGKKA